MKLSLYINGWFLLLVAPYQLQASAENTKSDVLLQTDNANATDPQEILNIQAILSELKKNYEDLSMQFQEYRENASSVMEHMQTKIDNLSNITIRSQSTLQYGFSAVVSTKLTHIPLGTKVVFDKVHFRSGGAYDRTSGIFTAPVDGIYLFSIFCHSSDAKTLVLAAKVEGMSVSVCVSEPAFAGEDDTGGNMFVTHLTTGQRVWIETFEVSDVSIYPSFTTFSGVLIQG